MSRAPYRVEHDPARDVEPVPTYVNGVRQPDRTRTKDSWQVVDADGAFCASAPFTDEGRAWCELKAAELAVGDDVLPVRLADGRTIPLPRRMADRVRGVDAYGYVVVAADDITNPDGSEFLYPLTPCCYASGKGSIDSVTGVVCRSCYCDVEDVFGGTTEVVVPVAV